MSRRYLSGSEKIYNMRVCLKCGQVASATDKCCRECGSSLGQSNNLGGNKIERKDCPFCEGAGSIPRTASALDRAMHRADTCEVCKGAKENTFDIGGNKKLLECGRCNGTGRLWKTGGISTFHPCDACKGKGWLVK